MSPQKLFFSVLFGLLLLVSGCRDIFQPPQWDVDALVPVAQTTIDFDDLETDSLLKVDTDRSLALVFSEKLFSLELDSLFEIPDTGFKETSPPYPLSVNLPPGNPLYSDTIVSKYNLSGAEITTSKVRQGSIVITLSNTLNEAVLFTYSVPTAIKNGQIFQVQELLPAGTISSPTSRSFNYDLAGYDLDLTGPNQNSYNTYVSIVNAVVDPNGQIVNVPPGTYLSIESSFSKILPEYVEGYFGQRVEQATSNGETTDLFNYVLGGTFDLEEVNLNLRISNGVGVDLATEITSLSSINSTTGNIVSLNHSSVGTNINLNRAGISGAIYNAPSVTFSNYFLQFDDGNSNLDELIENQPDKLGYELNLTLNPLGNVSNHRDFLFYDKGIDIFLDLEVPLSLSANQLTLADTSDMKLTSREDAINNIIGGFLYAYVENGFPFDAEVQMLLLDSNFVFIDSLVAPGSVIPSAPVDGNLRVNGTSPGRVAFPINQNQIDDLYESRYLVTRITLNTTSQPNFIKIYSQYQMDIKVVADFTYRVDDI